MENKWRAVRYGLDGKLIDFGKQTEVPERELIVEYLDFVDDVVDELDSRNEIDYIHTMLREGTGADRQLRSLPRNRRPESSRRLHGRRNSGRVVLVSGARNFLAKFVFPTEAQRSGGT